MKTKVKDLKKAYAEIIDVMLLVDQKTQEPLEVPEKATESELIALIKKHGALIEPEDEFTPETQEIIDFLLNDNEEEEEDSDLTEEIEDAETILELKDLVKEHEVFKPLRKGIGLMKEKDIEKLREKMLTLLDGEDEEEEEVETPKKQAKKEVPAQKEKVKKEKGPSLTSKRVEFLSPLIKEGKYTKKQLLEMYMKKNKGENEVGVATLLTDAKNPKYNKFDKLVISGENGILKFSKK